MISSNFDPNNPSSNVSHNKPGKIPLVGSVNGPTVSSLGDKGAAQFEATQNTLGLVYQAAIDKLNELLHTSLGDGGLESVAHLDNSPEATADRIVSLSTGFFEAFKAQHPDLDDDAVLDKFIDTISKGIDQGFSEAREILAGLNVLEGKIASDVDDTYDFVQEGLAIFREEHSAS